MAKKMEPQEVAKETMATKTVYHYVDAENGIDVKSREVFKKKKCIVHFPFDTRKGTPKYDIIHQIIFENIDVPSGFLKTPSRGYGFTRDLSPIIDPLKEKFPGLNEIKITDKEPTKIVSKKAIIFNANDIENIRKKLRSLNEKHRSEKKTSSNNLLSDILPKVFKKAKSTYTKGALAMHIQNYGIKSAMLSEDDVRSLSGLLADIPHTHPFVKKGKILDAKDSLDKILVEDIIAEYEKLLSQKTHTQKLEDNWQNFFRDNILYFNFGYVEKFEKERIQGDSTLNIPDFILLDTYSYLDVFEIKTHLTQLLSYDTGRKNFYWFSEAARAISQAENYIDSIIEQEAHVIKSIRDEYGIQVDAVRPVVYVIASSKLHIAGNSTSRYRGKQSKKLWNDFRRLNNSLKNIRFVLYDELLEIFKNIRKRLNTKKADN